MMNFVEVMPRCRVDYEPGDEWDEGNKSYSSYNIAYQPQGIRLDAERSQPYPLEVRVAMGINLHPAASGLLHMISLTDCFSTQGFRNTASPDIIHKSESSVDLGFRPNIEVANTWNRGADECQFDMGIVSDPGVKLLIPELSRQHSNGRKVGHKRTGGD
jgi:hypothetical protein